MNFERLLIFRVGHLGDTVIGLPALWAVRRQLPHARITLLTNIDRKNPAYISPADVLPQTGLVDEYIAYPTNTRLLSRSGALLRLAIALRKERFDAALYLMPRARTDRQLSRDRAFFRLAGTPRVLGIDFLEKHRLDYPITFPTPRVDTESDFLLSLVHDAGFPPHVIETNLLLEDSETSAADRWLADSIGGTLPDKLIAVGIGAKWEFKRWSEEKYQNVISDLVQRKGCYPIIFGGPEDRKAGDRLIDTWGAGANACGELSIRESAALLGKCKLYLGNDTGTMHLAAAVGLPCVALFSSMDYVDRWLPIGADHRIFRTVDRCEGCLEMGSDSQHTCMDSIRSEDVNAACVEIIDKL